ncbi:MAG: hypothetical protein E7214_10215 [Clostridium sp.]|nr:hypothetical protein [Clostridium sp.]
MSKNKKVVLISVIILTIIFTISFFIFDNYLSNKEVEESNKEVMSLDKSNILSESMKISLFKDDAKEDETTLKNLKTKLNIEGDITEEKLSEVLSKRGYELDYASDNELTYKRDAKDSVEPDKFYIKDVDGYLAIFRSDSDGNLTITNPHTDIYSDRKKVKDLPKSDQEMIEKLEFKYNTKEEAEDKISELVS